MSESEANSIYNAFSYCLWQERVESFKNPSTWPFNDDVACSAQKMAEAGFFRPNPHGEPDLAKCFVCTKELNGWEENDDPWEEHKKHQNACEYVALNKKPSEMNLDTVLTLVEASVNRSVKKVHAEKQEKMEKEFKALSKDLDKKWKRKK